MATDDPILERLRTRLRGRYAVERELGRGGMGVVWLARDLALDRPVAIKVLRPELAAHPDARARFVREAQLAARLAHPHIVPIHAVEAHDDLVLFVMTYVPGETLAQRLRRVGPLPGDEARRMMQEVAWALAYAHQHGIVHRDVKPGNILLERASGRAMVTDFGIARPMADGATPRAAGTPLFMSPEQAVGDEVDGRSDLFGLGVTAYLALTGRMPYEDTGLRLLASGSTTATAPPVTSLRPQLDPALAAAIQECLAPRPEGRPASGEALAEALVRSDRSGPALPPALRSYLGGLRAFTVETASGVAVLAVLALEALVAGAVAGNSVSDFLLFFLTYATPIVAGVGIARYVQMVRRARDLMRQGYTSDDIREAVTREMMEDAEAERSSAPVSPEAEGALPPAVLGAAQVLGRAGVVWLWMVAFRWWVGQPSADGFLGTLLDALLWAGLTLGPVMAIRADIGRLLGPGRSSLGTRLWRWALDWKVFRVAKLGLRLPAAEAGPLALPGAGERATHVFEALPAEARQALSDLPALLQRLEREARALRERQEELDRAVLDAEAGPGVPGRESLLADLRAARDEAASRVAAAETALETIRIGLLRIRHGVGAPESLTEDIEAAIALNARIGELMETPS